MHKQCIPRPSPPSILEGLGTRLLRAHAGVGQHAEPKSSKWSRCCLLRNIMSTKSMRARTVISLGYQAVIDHVTRSA